MRIFISSDTILASTEQSHIDFTIEQKMKEI